jgi:lysyl-tRNA synthetase class 2
MSDSATNVVWRPHATLATTRSRASMLAACRDFFASRNVLEVDTPALATHAVTEPNIESLQTGCENSPTLFLQTSPEHYMKRLLAAGYPDIYQICKVFRDGESGQRHQPEFTLVEWYRLKFSLQEMMQETVEFIGHVLDRPELHETVCYLSYVDAFAAAGLPDPGTSDATQLSEAIDADPSLQRSLGSDRDAWLDLLLADKVCREFSADRLTVLYHYPASQAALARRCPEDDRFADRFEIFLGDLELANGFVELTDADEQLTRFEKDRNRRRDRGQTLHEVDDNLIAALRSGLPECAGVAVGFDRLLMISSKSDDIADVNTFRPG